MLGEQRLSPWTWPLAPQHPCLPTGTYLENRCLRCLTPLLDSGTEGPRGNVLAMVPFLTKPLEPAGASRDGTFPFCTLRYFPRTIQHTLQVGFAVLAYGPQQRGTTTFVFLPRFPLRPWSSNETWAGYSPSCFLLVAQALHGLSLPRGWGPRKYERSASATPPQWARDEFEGLFQLPAEHVNQFMK